MRVSVVVIIVDGGETLMRCLAALAAGLRLTNLARERFVWGRLVAVSPLVCLVFTLWSVGEMVSYVTGRP